MSQTATVFGYTFDLNGAAAHEICKEKAATAMVLELKKVPTVKHILFLAPSFATTASFLPKEGSVFSEILEIAKNLNFEVVIKPLKGTGGKGVMKCLCCRDVESAIVSIFSKEYGLTVSPLHDITDEYRVVVLGGEVKMVYRKQRESLVGDGESTVKVLLSKYLASSPCTVLQVLSELDIELLDKIPGKNEEIPLQWKHNLGLGASAAFDIALELNQKISELALAAVAAIDGLEFCSVDIVAERGSGHLLVIEVNSGVMMDNLLKQAEGDVQLRGTIKSIYKEALLYLLAKSGSRPIINGPA